MILNYGETCLKIGVVFRINGAKMPVIYRHRFMSLIKEALQRADPEYKEVLYPPEGVSLSKKAKNFTFNISLPPRREIRKERFLVDDSIEIEDIVFHFPDDSTASMFVCSPDYRLITALYNGMLKIREYDFKNHITLVLERVFMLKTKKITADEVVFKTHAPVLVEDEAGNPVLPFELKRFQAHLNAIQDRLLKDIRGYGLKRELIFIPIKIKKQVVKHTLSGFREKTGKPFMVFTCFEGTFRLSGEPQDLQAIYEAGMGLRRGQGFGMVELLTQQEI